jgi:hypothetical protein
MSAVVQGFLLALILVGPVGGALPNGQNPSVGKPQDAAARNAADPTSKERPVELVSLIASVQWAPPEFAADLLIVIAESARVTESDWKKELLDQAFRVASDCQYSMPQKPVGPYPVDTRAGYLGAAFRLKLDALSLRCRVVESMLRVDKAKALRLFGEIGKLKFPPVNCDAGLVYEVSDFYKTAAKLFEEAFSAKEKQRGEHIRFLESLIEDISSPVQIPPAAHLVRSLDVSREQRESLVTALASRMTKLSGDDRSFSSSIYSVDDEIARLVHSCNEQGVSVIELIRSSRSYYLKHFSASRCSDTLRNTGDTGPVPHEVNQFNKRVRSFAEKKVSEIEPEEVRPSRIEGKVDVHFYWRSPRSQKLMQSFKQLKFGSGRKPLTKAEIDSVEWRTDFSEFFKGLLAWDKNDEDSVEDYFHQKCNLFEGVMNLPLGVPEKDEVIREFVPFLWRFDLKSLSRIEWFWHAKNLLPRALGQQGGESSANRRAVLESSNNLVLYAYAEVWKTLSSPPKDNAEPANRKPTRNP